MVCSWVSPPFSLPHNPTFWLLHRYSWLSPQTREKEKEKNLNDLLEFRVQIDSEDLRCKTLSSSTAFLQEERYKPLWKKAVFYPNGNLHGKRPPNVEQRQ